MSRLASVVLAAAVALPAASGASDAPAKARCDGPLAVATVAHVEMIDGDLVASGAWEASGGATGVLLEYRIGNDVLMAAQTLKRGFTTDVTPILAQARVSKGAAIDPIGAYRASGYRAKCGDMRPGKQSLGGGIV